MFFPPVIYAVQTFPRLALLAVPEVQLLVNPREQQGFEQRWMVSGQDMATYSQLRCTCTG